VRDDQRVRTAYHEAAHAIVAELLGVRVDVVSIRPAAERHKGVTIHASLGHDEVTELLGRRQGKSVLARWGVVPVPFFDPEERRRAETSVMISLAGHLGEFLMPEFPSGGYRDDMADIDQARAVAASVELTAQQTAWLDDAEHREEIPGDDDAAFQKARWNTGEEAAGAFVHYLSWETRRLVFSELVRRIIPLVVDRLLAHEIIPGSVVREIIESVTGETLEHREEATTLVRAAAKQEHPPRRIPEDTPVSRLMICHIRVIWSKAGGCSEGTIVLDTDPRVAEAPEAFRPLSEHLG